ncbi:MAG TPA: hypothetical protein VK530_19465 [Candidatus Acidoferrum sp.]|nr:hypothetical protein [Candidatus Acidoferrum sp.]
MTALLSGFGINLKFPDNRRGGFYNGTIDEARAFTFAAAQFNTNDLLMNLQRAVTLAATNNEPPRATLTGSANPTGLPTSAWFKGARRSTWKLHIATSRHVSLSRGCFEQPWNGVRRRQNLLHSPLFDRFAA